MSAEPEIRERPSERAPWPNSEDELIAYVREMAAWPEATKNMDEGYGRCVYALAYGALATFNYLAHLIGVTGFQASCADMEIVAQNRRMEHGFILLDANKLLYPQYDVPGEVAEWIVRTRTALAPVARKMLAEKEDVHPDVRARWEELAALAPANEEEADHA